MKRMTFPGTKFALFNCLALLLFVFACGKDSLPGNSQAVNTSAVYTLTEASPLGNNIDLPTGTQWKYVDMQGSQVEFTLPDGYAYLKKDLARGTYYVSPDPGGGGYSCSCSKTGSCKVFYQDKLGYGCLQNTCTGSATGTPVALKTEIVGILNKDNDQFEKMTSFTRKASLSEEGKMAFFQLPEVQKEISKNYNFLYANYPKPDFQKIDPNHMPAGYFIAKFMLFGVETGILVPKDESLFRAMPELRTVAAAPTSCACSGTQGGDKCTFIKDCFMGYCAYSCSGCTTCTMK